MSVLLNRSTKVIVQGITGTEAQYHTRDMMNYGTNIVAGVVPGKGGEWVIDEKIPVFDTMLTAVEATEANTSIIFVPSRRAVDSMIEAADSGVELVVCITDGIPVHDVSKVCQYFKMKGVRLVGPNCSGIITPGEQKVGLIPSGDVIPGNIGIVSRSATLSCLFMRQLKEAGMGVSTCVGIGGDMINGTSLVDALELFESDPNTDKVLLIGETGGLEEERAAKYAAYKMSKPVTAFIAGISIPEGVRITRTGSMTENGLGMAKAKIDAFLDCGLRATNDFTKVTELLRN